MPSDSKTKLSKDNFVTKPLAPLRQLSYQFVLQSEELLQIVIVKLNYKDSAAYRFDLKNMLEFTILH
jgi:hypothetical protein